MSNHFSIGSWVERDDYIPPEGIHIRSRRGDIGLNWWSRKWLSEIEQTVSPQSLEYGRRIARKSQVLDLVIDGDQLRSTIQENRRNRFEFSIQLNIIPPTEWEDIVDQCQNSPLIMAYLFSKQIPEEIEKLFEEKSYPFLPSFLSDFQCTCHETEHYCSHLVAVACVIAEQMDQNPFIIFAMNGLNEESFFNRIKKLWKLPYIQKTIKHDVPSLDDQIDFFYQSKTALRDDVGTFKLTESDVLSCLGYPPFFPSGENNIQDLMSQLYQSRSKK